MNMRDKPLLASEPAGAGDDVAIGAADLPSGPSPPPPTDSGEDQSGVSRDGPVQPEIVKFEREFFRGLDDPHFRLTDLRGGEPVFVYSLDADEVVMPFKWIVKEFDVHEASSDAHMLGTIAKALRFVKSLRPGDPLPPELFSNAASWSVEPNHVAVARHKLSARLLVWVSGGDAELPVAELLERLSQDEDARERLNQALGESGRLLGFENDAAEKVASMLDEFASDLAYIETLREKFAAIERIDRYLKVIRKIYHSERSIVELTRSVERLHVKAVDEFRENFEKVDLISEDIMNLLKNIEKYTNYICSVRNELHSRLIAWDDVVRDWETLPRDRSDIVAARLRHLYRFLAPVYMTVAEWPMPSLAPSRVKKGTREPGRTP